MQFADFDRVDAAGVRAELNRLLEIRMLSPEQAALVDTAALETFFASALYRRMRVSPALYREKRFTVSEDGARLTGESGDRVLIQGVVDCFFKNETAALPSSIIKPTRCPTRPRAREGWSSGTRCSFAITAAPSRR